MSRLRLAVMALLTGVLVGTRARRRHRTPAPGLPLRLRTELIAAERRLDARIDQLDRARRRTGAVAVATAVLLVVPGALVASRPDVPDAIVAAVFAVALLVAAGALATAALIDRRR